MDSSKAKFTMSGGEISGNGTAGIGGGIRLSGPTTLNGKVKITGNTKADSTETNNICLCSNYTIPIGSNFSTDSPIGVHFDSSPHVQILRMLRADVPSI